MANSFPVDRSNHEDEGWAWLEPHFRQHRRQLYLFALGVLGNREDAEDAMQIVLLNAHRALVRGERPTWPRAWLFAIALNVCRRLLRQASRRHALVASKRELLSLESGSDAPAGSEIFQALSSLPSRQRKIFLLRELRGLSYAELSERLDLSPAAAESLLARARRRLRAELAPSDDRTGSRSQRRLPLISFPGAGTALRLARASATFKLAGPKLAGLAGLAGTAAIAPALVVGLHAAPERSQPARLQAATTAIVQPVQRTRPSLGERLSSSPASIARPTRSRPPGALPFGARPLSPAGAGPGTVASATSAATAESEPGSTGVVSQQLPPTRDESSGVKGQPPAEPSGATGLVPTPDATSSDAVDESLATLGAAVDEIVTAVPVPAAPAPVVPPDVIPDAVPEGVVPDPPPVAEDVLDVASSAEPAEPAAPV